MSEEAAREALAVQAEHAGGNSDLDSAINVESLPADVLERGFQADVLNRFSFHSATPVTGPQHDYIRHVHGDLAAHILDLVPAGRHQALALTALQESMMWCNAAIACDSPAYDDDPNEAPTPPEPGSPLD